MTKREKPINPEPWQCTECGKALYTEIEHETRLCGHCADRMYEREQARREWEYYHND